MTDPADPIIVVDDLVKVYDSDTGGGYRALDGASLTIRAGEILALLGSNGAGKTTLISALCGIVRPTSGTMTVGGHDVVRDYRAARRMIGLVPQEITLEPFEAVISTVRFSRGLFGYRRDDALIERILRTLSLWDKRDARIRELSGGMKRRVLIAKALSHEPRVLFLDEPTAGVDVELRRDMWEVVRALKADGVTVILTTHYIEEAEAIADRIAVIRAGRILLTENKDQLMARMGHRELRVTLTRPLDAVPPSLAPHGAALEADAEGLRRVLLYSFKATGERTGVTEFLTAVREAGLTLSDLDTRQSSLEDIFVELIGADEGDGTGANGARIAEAGSEDAGGEDAGGEDAGEGDAPVPPGEPVAASAAGDARGTAR